MADDRRPEGVVVVIAGETEQLADAGLDVRKLFAELFLQLVGLARSGKPVFEIQFVDQRQSAVRRVAGGPPSAAFAAHAAQRRVAGRTPPRPRADADA